MKLLFGPVIRVKACLLSLIIALTTLAISFHGAAQTAQPAAPSQQKAPPEKVYLDPIERIKEEESRDSQVMEMVGYLTDVIGPRLTGSPNLKKAQQYAMGRLREWGIENAHTEAWGPFGRGWSLENFSAQMIAPTFSSLIAYPKAWSPDTNGPVRGEVGFFDVKYVA